MRINQMYKYKKNGVVFVGKELPAEAEVLETMNILNADKGKYLVRISDDENVGSSIWLKNGDVKENYKEVERKEIDNADN
jgi:hypothetical protein